MSIKKACKMENHFYKLKIKVKEELVAYNVPKNSYNMQKTGKHLTAEQYNEALDNPGYTNCRYANYYESEIGRLKGSNNSKM
ncbi:MAG: hypothetical protein CM15mP106_2340 [Candidatus Neomarinimicrobiota bacterium]|nr:MAG: hypothetical protein CM15mP106_2340 [Candidatus Neomarinimicrobiota bacterium]